MTEQFDDHRHDCMTEINGVVFRMSYLYLTKKLIYTAMDGSRAGTVNIIRPFASRTPHEILLRNEVVNHMDHQDSDTRKEQWPDDYDTTYDNYGYFPPINA